MCSLASGFTCHVKPEGVRSVSSEMTWVMLQIFQAAWTTRDSVGITYRVVPSAPAMTTRRISAVWRRYLDQRQSSIAWLVFTHYQISFAAAEWSESAMTWRRVAAGWWGITDGSSTQIAAIWSWCVRTTSRHMETTTTGVKNLLKNRHSTHPKLKHRSAQ